jgi:hypothetical protein
MRDSAGASRSTESRVGGVTGAGVPVAGDAEASATTPLIRSIYLLVSSATHSVF